MPRLLLPLAATLSLIALGIVAGLWIATTRAAPGPNASGDWFFYTRNAELSFHVTPDGIGILYRRYLPYPDLKPEDEPAWRASHFTAHPTFYPGFWTASGDDILRGTYSRCLGLGIRYWSLSLLLCIPPAFGIARLHRHDLANFRRSHSLCPTCGYDLRATPAQCPECGTPSPKPAPPK